jgi:hypothetical protein
MLLVFLLIKLVEAKIRCQSANATGLTRDYSTFKPGGHYTFECIADQPSEIKLEHNPMQVTKRITPKSLEFDYRVPSKFVDILNHADRSFVCRYKNESCTLFINIDFEPQEAFNFKRVKMVKAGELVLISTPFEVNPYPPLMYSIRFKFDNYSTRWINYTNEAKQIKLKKTLFKMARLCTNCVQIEIIV